MKKNSKLNLITLVIAATAVLAMGVCARAQTPTDPPASAAAIDTGNAIVNLVTGQAVSHPWIFTVLAVVGALRLLIKPIFSALHAYADSTESKQDDEWVRKVEESKATKTLLWLLDYVASVKLKRP